MFGIGYKYILFDEIPWGNLKALDLKIGQGVYVSNININLDIVLIIKILGSRVLRLVVLVRFVSMDQCVSRNTISFFNTLSNLNRLLLSSLSTSQENHEKNNQRKQYKASRYQKCISVSLLMVLEGWRSSITEQANRCKLRGIWRWTTLSMIVFFHPHNETIFINICVEFLLEIGVVESADNVGSLDESWLSFEPLGVDVVWDGVFAANDESDIQVSNFGQRDQVWFCGLIVHVVSR